LYVFLSVCSLDDRSFALFCDRKTAKKNDHPSETRNVPLFSPATLKGGGLFALWGQLRIFPAISWQIFMMDYIRSGVAADNVDIRVKDRHLRRRFSFLRK